MINEEITDKHINLAIRISSITYNAVKKAIEKLLAKLEEQQKVPAAGKTPELKEGKQTLKQLKKHHEGLTPLELTAPHLRLLNREMKRAKIDFSVSRDGKGKYVLHFKGKDADEMKRALNKYTQKLVRHTSRAPSIKKTLAAAKALAQSLSAGRDKEKNKSRGAR